MCTKKERLPMKFRLLVFCSIYALAFNVRAGWIDNLRSALQPEEFKSVEGRFSVKTPATLKERIVTNEAALPGDGTHIKLDVHNFSGCHGGLAYSVIYNDFPSSFLSLGDAKTMTDAILDSAAAGLQTLNNGKIQLNSIISLAGYTGREVIVESQTNHQKYSIKARYFLVERRLYQIMVVVPTGVGGSVEINDFLGSFHLLK